MSVSSDSVPEDGFLDSDTASVSSISTTSTAESFDSWTLLNSHGDEIENAASQTQKAESPIEAFLADTPNDEQPTESTSKAENRQPLSEDHSFESVHEQEFVENEATLGEDVSAQERMNQNSESADGDLHAQIRHLISLFSSGGCVSNHADDPAVPESSQGFNEDLPVNFAQMCSNRIRNYIHTYNSPLNWKLTLLLALVTATGLGLGIGHFVGITIRRRNNTLAQLEQMKTLQANLQTCNGQLMDVQTHRNRELSQLKRDLTVCQFDRQHAGVCEGAFGLHGNHEKSPHYNNQEQILLENELGTCRDKLHEATLSSNRRNELFDENTRLRSDLFTLNESLSNVQHMQTKQFQALRRQRVQQRVSARHIRLAQQSIDELQNEVSSYRQKMQRLTEEERQLRHILAQLEDNVGKLRTELEKEKDSFVSAQRNFAKCQGDLALTNAELQRQQDRKADSESASVPENYSDSRESRSANRKDLGDIWRDFISHTSNRLSDAFGGYASIVRNLTSFGRHKIKDIVDDAPAQRDAMMEQLWVVFKDIQKGLGDKIKDFQTASASFINDFKTSLPSTKYDDDDVHVTADDDENVMHDSVEEEDDDFDFYGDGFPDKTLDNIRETLQKLWETTREKADHLRTANLERFNEMKSSIEDRLKNTFDGRKWQSLRSDWSELLNTFFTQPTYQSDFDYSEDEVVEHHHQEPLPAASSNSIPEQSSPREPSLPRFPSEVSLPRLATVVADAEHVLPFGHRKIFYAETEQSQKERATTTTINKMRDELLEMKQMWKSLLRSNHQLYPVYDAYAADLKRLLKTNTVSSDALQWWNCQRLWWALTFAKSVHGCQCVHLPALPSACRADGSDLLKDWQLDLSDYSVLPLNKLRYFFQLPKVAEVYARWFAELWPSVDTEMLHRLCNSGDTIASNGKRNGDESSMNSWLLRRAKHRDDVRKAEAAEEMKSRWLFRRSDARREQRDVDDNRHFRDGQQSRQSNADTKPRRNDKMDERSWSDLRFKKREGYRRQHQRQHASRY